MKTEYRDENFKLMPPPPETDKYDYLSNSYYYTENYLNEEYFDSHFFSGKFSDIENAQIGIGATNQDVNRTAYTMDKTSTENVYVVCK